MSKRTVWGRRTAKFQDETYVLEMRESAVYIRRKHYREAVPISFTRLINFVRPQMELPGITFTDDGMDQSNQSATVSTMPEGFVVHSEPESGDSAVHEGDQPPPAQPEGWKYGVDPYLGPPLPESFAAGETTENRPTNDQLSSVD